MTEAEKRNDKQRQTISYNDLQHRATNQKKETSRKKNPGTKWKETNEKIQRETKAVNIMKIKQRAHISRITK